jgi:pimeloyl-ACP methyl ester carboxylesterase
LLPNARRIGSDRAVRDVRAVVEWTRARAPGVPIRLVGWSAGAATALLYASEDPAIDRVVAINPFASMEEMASRRRPFFVRVSVYEEALRIVEVEAGFRIADVSPLRAATRVRGDVLVIVGEADQTIPPEHGHRVHEALGDRSTLMSLPGIGHDDWWTHPDFSERVLGFVQ